MRLVLCFCFVIASSLAWGHGADKCKEVGNNHYQIEHFTPASSDDPGTKGNNYRGGHGHVYLKDDKPINWGYWTRDSYEIARRIRDATHGFIDCTAPPPQPEPTPTPDPTPPTPTPRPPQPDPQPEPEPTPTPKPDPQPEPPQPEPPPTPDPTPPPSEEDTRTSRESTPVDIDWYEDWVNWQISMEETESNEPQRGDTQETTPDTGGSDTGDSEPVVTVEPSTPENGTEPKGNDETTRSDTGGTEQYQLNWTIPEGLSIIHVPLAVDDITRISDLFRVIPQAGFIISLDSQKFTVHYPRFAYWRDRDIKSYEAFIVSMSESTEIPLTGRALPINITLSEGWNLIGFPRHRSGPIRNYGTTIGLQNDAWIFDNEHAPGTGYLIESDHSFTTGYGGTPWGTPVP